MSELYFNTETGNINFMHNGKSYQLYIDTKLGAVKLDEIFENKDNKTIVSVLLDKDIVITNDRVVGNEPEEFISGNDYGKIYDFLVLPKDYFLERYGYINNKSYDYSMEIAMQPKYTADLMRQAENLLNIESNSDIADITYMQEIGVGYISAIQWKTAITEFVEDNYLPEELQEFTELCGSSGV